MYWGFVLFLKFSIFSVFLRRKRPDLIKSVHNYKRILFERHPENGNLS